jgi:two-component system cell cycle response regulator
MQILLADSSRVIRLFWREKLEARGYAVLTAASAAEAEEIIERRRIDLVLVAYNLSDGDGIGFIRALRRDCEHQATPAILLCGRDDSELEDEARAVGASGVADKSDLNALWESLRLAIRNHALDLTGQVLYVEDSPTAAHVTLEALTGLELSTVHVKSGAEALAALERDTYDLVITDARLDDGMNGVELARAIRARPDDEVPLPILAISSADDAAARRELFDAGITDFLAKSALVEEIPARVTNLLARRRLALALRKERREQAHASLNDSASGTLTHHAFRLFAEKSCGRARRYGFPLVLMMLSVEGLQREHEEDAEEGIIATVGHAIIRDSRASDMAGRHGDAAFLLLLEHCDLAGAARRLKRLLAELAESPGLPAGLNFAVGSAGDSGAALDFNRLLAAAGRAHAKARRAGHPVQIAIAHESAALPEV